MALLIVWDEPKRISNLVKHDLDFSDFAAGFDFDSAVLTTAGVNVSGSARFKLIGDFGGRIIVAAIVALLGTEALSLISLRPAGLSERRLYDKA